MKPTLNVLDFSRANDLLAYNAKTGAFLWKKDRGIKFLAGSVAGYTDPRGYTAICIDYRRHYAHRLAWLLSYGNWPAKQIDHINGNKTDNRLANLREATPAQNNANSKTHKRNKSGFRGVSWSTRDRCWRAFISFNRARRSLGDFQSAYEANAAYQREARRLFGEFQREKAR